MKPSRIFRQVATIEIFTIVSPEYDGALPPNYDVEAAVRSGVEGDEGSIDIQLVAGDLICTDPEELK